MAKSSKFYKLFNNFIIISIFISLWNLSALASMSTFQSIFNKIEQDYVQPTEKQKLFDAALEGMLTSLDPHSGYYTDEDLEDFINQTRGEFGGIGVEIIFERGAMKVISPIDELPAEKAGVKAGDYIVKVGNDAVSKLGYNKAIKHMCGDPGTKVRITVIREGEDKPLDFEITRDIVKIKSVRHHLENGIAYIRIGIFNENTINELKKSVKALTEEQKDALQGIILDVRNNPGGILDQAVAVSEYFIDHGLIVSTKGRNEKDNVQYNANRYVAKAPKVPMIVLINSGSASASEIVAGALQDHKRALIMGTKSFGKGSVQTFWQISKRAAIKLTTAMYYTPNGKSIQAQGIKPDIIMEQAKVDYPTNSDSKVSESSLKNFLKNEHTDTQTDQKDTNNSNKIKADVKKDSAFSGMYERDFQYARAYDLLTSLIILDKKYE